ncbi:transposase domain-containing protein [Brucella sp. NBRC 12950]|uniref:transposase domain-containing protein n=1 Tax=Brucella sp. NBRC 12950 TaxID=2994518 RepID=UPI0024A18488|nr:transposase domain-containing protein [Brucella sp. NBRC 12950]GLU26088.1 hypothetical protein Brsp01_13210 [Brucella sp. NBRC 12950]
MSDGVCNFNGCRVEINSNRFENLTRPIALNRKNALLEGRDKERTAWGRVASLIETGEINGIQPFAYLMAILIGISVGPSQSRFDNLLAWIFNTST